MALPKVLCPVSLISRSVNLAKLLYNSSGNPRKYAMYRLGEVEHRHRKFYILLAGFIVVLVAVGLALTHFLKPDTQIGKAPKIVTTHISYDSTKIKSFDTPLFTISVPDDWKAETRNSDIPPPTYVWQGTVKDNTS